MTVLMAVILAAETLLFGGAAAAFAHHWFDGDGPASLGWAILSGTMAAFTGAGFIAAVTGHLT